MSNSQLFSSSYISHCSNTKKQAYTSAFKFKILKFEGLKLFETVCTKSQFNFIRQLGSVFAPRREQSYTKTSKQDPLQTILVTIKAELKLDHTRFLIIRCRERLLYHTFSPRDLSHVYLLFRFLLVLRQQEATFLFRKVSQFIR